MELIKENLEKKRRVYFCGDRYRKVWEDKADWIYTHVKILERVVPGYVLGYNNDYIEYAVIDGIVADSMEHTDEFIKQVYAFCLENIAATKPWVHGDWVLSNIIVQPDGRMAMIDWDNLGMYRETDYMKKLHRDLHSAFGDKFFEIIKHDPTSI